MRREQDIPLHHQIVFFNGVVLGERNKEGREISSSPLSHYNKIYFLDMSL